MTHHLEETLSAAMRELLNSATLSTRLIVHSRDDGSVEVVKAPAPSTITLREIAWFEKATPRTIRRRWVETGRLKKQQDGTFLRRDYLRLCGY